MYIFGDGLSICRNLIYFSPEKFNTNTFVTQEQNSLIDNGKFPISVFILEQLVTFVNISISELFKISDFNEALNLPILQKIILYNRFAKIVQQASLIMFVKL